MAGLIFWIFVSNSGLAQPHTFAESVQLKTMRGKLVSFSSIAQPDSLTLICFWSTSSEESIAELNAINQIFESWKKSVAFHLIAISTDEGNSTSRVRPTVNEYEWKFEVYTDFTGELRQALNATNMPECLILQKGKILYQQSGYEAGSEKYLLDKLLHLALGQG
jgi:hypothetical protein